MLETSRRTKDFPPPLTSDTTGFSRYSSSGSAVSLVIASSAVVDFQRIIKTLIKNNLRMMFSMHRLVLIVMGICLINFSSGMDYSEAEKVIAGHLSSSLHSVKTPGSPSLCQDNTCCNITSTNSCSMGNFPKDQSTLVLPGGKTRCIFSYSTPFAFQVIPGASDKVVVYFQGGGGCWNEATTSPLFCLTDVEPQTPIGIFDRTNPKNKFKDYTIVHILYCSGDAHGGNTTRPYNDKKGQPVVQAGLLNVQATLDWVKSQQSAGHLATTINNLIIMGCSAGSLGTQLWAQEILRQLSWKTAAIIPDSFAGVAPNDVVGQVIYDYGYCSCGFLSDELYKKCMDKQLTVYDLGLEFLNEHPTVPYAFIEAKTDAVQLAYYVALVVTTNSTEKAAMTSSEFYTEVNNIFSLYNTERSNFLTYLIDGDHHCYTQQALYFQADTKGAEDNGQTNKSEMLVDWINRLPLQENEAFHSECEEGSLPDTYCSSKVVPKEFVEHY